MLVIHKDCKYFLGDRPCRFHKASGSICESCTNYERISGRILVIKLDAIGDVLRTTSILPGLRRKYKGAQITWITKAESLHLLANNPLVDRVYDLSTAQFVLGTDAFDLVINLDAAALSARLAAVANGKEKLGFGYDVQGYVYPYNAEAQQWFEMGVRDDIKRQNIRTYQSIALEICRLPEDSPNELSIVLTDSERAEAAEFAASQSLSGAPLIGFNTGAGGRWENKKWTEEGYIILAGMLKDEYPGCRILLYGGPEERRRNARLATAIPGAVDMGTDNSLRRFAALVSLADVMVLGDTLAMHIAIALGKKVVVLFGPTSASEIELYSRGEKIVTPLSCACCYKGSCDVKPNCMESIEPVEVFKALKRSLT